MILTTKKIYLKIIKNPQIDYSKLSKSHTLHNANAIVFYTSIRKQFPQKYKRHQSDEPVKATNPSHIYRLEISDACNACKLFKLEYICNKPKSQNTNTLVVIQNTYYRIITNLRILSVKSHTF